MENFEKSRIEWETEYTEVKEKKEDPRIRNLLPEKIPDCIFDITQERITEHYKGSLPDPEEQFVLKDVVSLVENNRTNVGGTGEFIIELEIKGRFKNLEEEYKKTLKEKISNLQLNPEKLYAILSWRQDLDIYDKEKEEINEDTVLNNFYNSKIVEDGKM